MASPTGVYSELLSTTLRDIAKTAVDSSRKAHPLFETLRRNFKSQAGGAEMQLPVILGQEAAPSLTTDGSVAFSPVKSADIITSAKYTFDSAEIGQVRLEYMLLEKNSGKNQLINLLATHREALMYQFRKSFVSAMHREHAARPAGSIYSLDSLCNDAVTTVGGIDYTATGNSGWRPVTQDASGNTNIKQIVRELVDGVLLNSEGVRPDVIITGKNGWDMLREYLDDHSTLTAVGSTSSVEFEWESVRFNGVEVRWDYDCPADRMYAIYTPALHWTYLNGAFMQAQPAQPVYVLDNGVVKNTMDLTYPVISIMSVGTNQRRTLGMVAGVGE